MTQQDKNLLIKDLCARLPYGIKFKHSEGFDTFEGIADDLINPTNEHWYNIEDIKPYLFPMSSMTEEQKAKLASIADCDDISEYGIGIETRDYDYIKFPFRVYVEVINYLNQNHFDYRGLIDKGLAINATGLNIY